MSFVFFKKEILLNTSERALYDASKKEFACLDGSKKIPFAQVNDDYCDCPDGSDEPGQKNVLN